jgi:hypothetical protein
MIYQRKHWNSLFTKKHCVLLIPIMSKKVKQHKQQHLMISSQNKLKKWRKKIMKIQCIVRNKKKIKLKRVLNKDINF